MTLAAYWAATDAEVAAASTIVRADARLGRLYLHGIAWESWRQYHLAASLGPGLPFWQEAQNDFLLSYLHAGRGVWRSALQALRSFLENATGALYYSEHPVEAKRFDAGTFRLAWSDTKDYLKAYPYSSPTTFRRDVLGWIGSEYAQLSQAVHGSSEAFRMTAGRQFPSIASAAPERINVWRLRTTATAKAIHFILLQHFATQLRGARLPALRENIGRALTQTERQRIRRDLGIVLPTP
jgi:hypothetical protein